ncbi:uncharacterized protein N7500_009520 [Penicillium coprophilum]|uniref:uncharacterized protein n=1 Tax=Penicillium coprophilum TaxID=36646 RepID=UPI0023A6177E|nr:uncharacterized protein N7500_009520 [Penicillium coprophilum]KAJ5154081.1 hypothetical protein N7500_009520 [Penicillium coprophilum]
MPPIRSQSSQNSIEQEGRAFKNGDISSISLAARTFNIPCSTLRYRLSGIQERYPLLSSRFLKRYNYECAKYKDPKIITKWFNLV